MPFFTRLGRPAPPIPPPASFGETFSSWSTPWREAILLLAPTALLGFSHIHADRRQLVLMADFLDAFAPSRPLFAPDPALDALCNALPRAHWRVLSQLGDAWAGASLPDAIAASRLAIALQQACSGRLGLPHFVSCLNHASHTAWPAPALAHFAQSCHLAQRALDLDSQAISIQDQLLFADRICLSARMERYSRLDPSAKRAEALFNWEANMELPLSTIVLGDDERAWIAKQWSMSPLSPTHEKHPELPPDLPYWDALIARRIFLFLGPDFSALPRQFLDRRSQANALDRSRLAPLSQGASEARARLAHSLARPAKP